MIQLLPEDIALFHEEMVERFRGAQGIRDNNLLESATGAPMQSVFGEDLYPTIEEKAARLCIGLIKNHPFIDGNKRTGIHTMLVFLYVNGIELNYDDKELEELAVKVADGSVSHDELVFFIRRTAHDKYK